MNHDKEKLKHSKRRHKDEVAIAKQVKIGKQHGLGFYDKAIKQPHRMAKHHAMDCGRPGCVMCSNPRRTFKELTIQEKRSLQELNESRNIHSNGTPPDNI